MNYLDLNLEKEFVGKRIIVTGASRGLGAMACKSLAESGAKIVMLSRSKKEMDKLMKAFIARGGKTREGRQIYTDAHALGIPVNIVDQPELCSFYHLLH